MTCRAFTRRGSLCQYFGRFNGYCGYHRPRLLNRLHKCAIQSCLHQVSNQEFIFCDSHNLYEHRNRCHFHENGNRCRNMTLNVFSYCEEHDIFVSDVEDMFLGYSLAGLAEQFEYDHDIISYTEPLITQIQQKPKVKKIILKNKIEDTCSICLEEFKLQEKLYKLKCKHHYHINCLDNWLKMKNTCPLDRKIIE
jgi:hypothetical protein